MVLSGSTILVLIHALFVAFVCVHAVPVGMIMPMSYEPSLFAHLMSGSSTLCTPVIAMTWLTSSDWNSVVEELSSTMLMAVRMTGSTVSGLVFASSVIVIVMSTSLATSALINTSAEA